MAKLMLMQGLPAAGKSQRARELLEEYGGRGVRINRDLLREMLHGKVWSSSREAITRECAAGLARMLLQRSPVGGAGGDLDVVVIDDTNLAPGVVARWQALAQECGAEYEALWVDTPLDICIERDAQRPEHVGRSVIVGMALQYGLYPKPQEGFVLCDIDGTLANIDHRLHYVQETPKNWDRFFAAMQDDTPRGDIITLIEAYQARGCVIVLVSGRPETYRHMTMTWLLRYCPGIRYEALFMRRDGDHRPDTVVKEEMLFRYFPETGWIHAAVDDRPSILAVWRTYGIPTIDVGMGVDF